MNGRPFQNRWPGSHTPERMLLDDKNPNTMMTQNCCLLSSPFLLASRLCAPTRLCVKKGAEGGDGQARGGGREGVEDDEGRWAMMQPIENSCEMIFERSRLEGWGDLRRWCLKVRHSSSSTLETTWFSLTRGIIYDFFFYRFRWNLIKWTKANQDDRSVGSKQNSM